MGSHKAAGHATKSDRGNKGQMGHGQPSRVSDMVFREIMPATQRGGQGSESRRTTQNLVSHDTALQTDPTALCQFKALRPLSEEMRGKTVAFKVSIALRGLPA